MDEKYIKDLYDGLGGELVLGKYQDYYNLITTDDSYISDVYNTKGESVFGKYEDFVSLVKKKDDLQPTVQEDATVSATVEEPQPISSEPLEAKYDDDWITSFVKKNESEAKALLSEELRGTQFEVRESGFGDALKVYNKLTDEDIEIDLSPTFGIVTETDKNNVKKILSSKIKNDATIALSGTTNLETFQEDPKTVVKSLKNLYKDIDINISDSDKFGYDITLTKGDKQEVIKSYASNDAKRKAYYKINNFIYENADTSKIDYKQFLSQNAEQNLNIKIDENELIGSVYNNEYFDKLFDYLEGAGKPVDQATKDAILSSKRKEISYVPTGMGAREVVKEAKLSPQEVIGIRDNFIKDNQDLVEAFDMQNIRRSESDMIDRAKTLKAETILKNAPNREILKQQSILLYDLKKEEETQNVLAEEVTTKKQIEELFVDFLEKNKDNLSKLDSEVDSKIVGGFVVFISKNIIPTEKDRKALAEINRDFIAIQKSSSEINFSLEEKRRQSISNLTDTKKMYEASRKNYDVLDASVADAKNTVISFLQASAIGGLNVSSDVKNLFFGDGDIDRLMAMSISKDKAEKAEFVSEFFPTKLDYKEAIDLGRKGEFYAREFATQSPYYAIAIASGGAGSVIGISGATLAATSFGISSFGEKIDEANAMQNIAINAKEELKELEDAKGSMPIDAYALIKYDLERAIESNDIANWQKYTAASAAGLAEGLITRYFGTIPNSAKIIKDFKFGSYIDDITKSNYKATVKAGKDWIGRGLGEVAEETSIETIVAINDALFLDKELDFSMLDDVAVTAFITSGTTNAPSVAYKTIMNQTVTSKYRKSIKDVNKQIDDIKKMLLSDDLPEATRKALHGKINERIGQIAELAASAESDVLLIGADGVKEMLTLSTVRDNISKKAGVKADDSQSAAEAKMKAYLASLDKTERKDTIGKLNYIDERRKQILGSIDYDGASEIIFGEKGKAIEEGLDPKLTPQEKFVEVYKQVRQEINTEAKKEYDAIQEERTVDVPSIKTEEEIEQSRKQEIEQVELAIAESNETGETATVNGEIVNEDTINEINSKYDAELKAFKATETEAVADTEQATEEGVISPPKTIPNAPKGVFLDIEMTAGKDGRKMSEQEIVDAIPLEEFEVDNDGTNLKIKIPRELSSSEMMKLMQDTEQEAIGQVIDGVGKLHAQSQELMNNYGGAFNPSLFKFPVKLKKIKKDEKPKAGNRLFNEPIKAVKAIADRYYKRVFKGERPRFEGVTKIDKEFAKRISDAFEAMQENPNDPNVKAAYEAMAKETMDQYKEFKDAGYTIEINNSEPYRNSQEMIDDLRENKRMKIFSTESGFGDAPITDKQRKENPLLRDSGVKDINGETLLVNDIFRAVHDFYGHAELGNSFGPLGEENAWNIHSRMFSPLARRAMTTETRGQNSYVNFSGVNDEAFKLRDQARKLRNEGRTAEADALVAKVYDIMKFADQKVGLLPEEFSSIAEVGADAKTDTKKNKIESFANRIIEGGIDSFSDDAIQFYAENKEAIDSLVQEKQKQTPKTESKVRSLALKIADGNKDFTDAEIDLFSANENKVRSEVDSIAKTRGIEITYKNILDSIKRPRKKVTVDEYAALKDQIRLEARAARGAKKDYKQKLKDLANNVRELVKSGSISTKQSDVITRRLANLNLDNPRMVDRFINYMDKVYNDAEYSDKISKAKKIKADIKRLKNNKEATLVKAAEDFLLIDASKIDDIDKYLEIAEELKEGLTKSTSKRITGAADIAKVNDYNSKTIQAIQEQQLEDLRKEFSEATGLDAKDLSYDDMKDILFSIEPVEDRLSELDKDKMLRDAGKKAIKYYLPIIQSMLNKSVDPFTGDTVEFSNPKLVKEFLKINFDRLKTSDLLLVVDSMINIATNPNALGGVGKIVSRAKGDSNAVAVKEKGIKTRQVWSVGRIWTTYISSMNLMFENVFGGQSKARYAEKMVGFSDLQQSLTRADNDVDSQFLEYKKKHKNNKPNGKRFFSLDNRVESAIIARLQRTIPGNEKAEFDRQKSLIEQSITKLESTEPKLYKIVKEAYDRIAKDSNNIEDVLSKADKANVDGVADIQAMWAKILPELKRVSLEYYNKVISEDAFYTPDFFDLLEKEVDVEKMDGVNFRDSSKAIYDKETGTIKKNNRIKRVDKRIVSFDFHYKNLMALRDAYRDVYSADNVQQIIGFLNAKEYSDIFVDDNVGDIVKNRLVKYSQIKRNKDFVSKDSKELSKIINRIAKVGVALALASVFQPIKQSVVIINTFLSLGTKSYLLPKAIYTYIFNKDARDFIKRTNATVTRRGISSLASIDSANQLIQEADGASGVLNKTLKGLSKISEASLNIFLVQPDKLAATISFLAFYMSKHDVKDFKNEKVDNDASQYADRKVSRAQAPSDSDTQGNLFTDKRTLTDVLRKMFFPFATFNMNQKTRVYADFRTVFNLFNESKEDVLDATSSIFATTVEIATFHAVGYYITSALTNLAFSLIGYEEDDEDEEKRKMNSIKGRLSSSLNDVLSPIPLVDPFVTGAANFILENIQEGDDVFKFFSKDKQTVLERFGTLGIAADKGGKIWDLSRMIVTRKYKDNYGRETELTNEAVSNMEMVLVPYMIYSLGLLPTDIGYLSDKIISVSKKMKKEDKPKLKYYGNIKGGFRMPSN